MRGFIFLTLCVFFIIHTALPYSFSNKLYRKNVGNQFPNSKSLQIRQPMVGLRKKKSPLALFVVADGSASQIAYIKSSVSFLSKIVVVVVVSSYLAFRNEKKEMDRFQKEVERDKEYRENMYFEAVETILAKLSDPVLKPAIKKEYERQLLLLDPDGKIKSFLEGKSSRPVIKSSSSTSTSSNFQSTNGITSQGIFQPIIGWLKALNERSSSIGDEFHKQSADIETILQQLDKNLSGKIDSTARNNLKVYLMNRFSKIDNDAKRKTALMKIKSKLNDLNYWVELNKRI